MEEVTKGGKGAFHARYKRWYGRFWARNQDLSVVSVLNDEGVRDVQAEVIGKRAEEDWAKTGSLKNPLVDRQRG